MQVNLSEAQAQLSELGQRVWEGEEVIIAKSGKPYLKLVPYQPEEEAEEEPEPAGAGKWRKPGSLQGRIWIAPDFDDNEDIIAAFEGKYANDARLMGDEQCK